MTVDLRPSAGDRCLICGTTAKLTLEHIIPQTLWQRWGIDPNRDDLAVFRTWLCDQHNQATGALHRREDMMCLIDTGGPVTPKTLNQLADWAVWVTLLLGLARGSGVIDAKTSRRWLQEHFTKSPDRTQGGPPKGTLVYAARITELIETEEPGPPPYLLALRGDSRVLLDAHGKPTGMSVHAGPVNATESIRVGSVVLLVVGPTHSSGPDHRQGLDEAAAEVGLERVFPLPEPLPALSPAQINVTWVSRLFTVVPIGADPSLAPAPLRALWTTATTPPDLEPH